MATNNSIMEVGNIQLDVSKLKNAALIKETKNLEQTQKRAYESYETARTAVNAQRKEQAKIFARVQDTKLYEKDGFKNMSEYCEAVGFTASKSLISQLVSCGRVYNDKNAPKQLSEIPFTNLGAMSKCINDADARKVMYSDAEKGKFDKATQEECATYAKEHDNKPQKAKVVKTYTAKRNGSLVVDTDKKPFHWTLDEYKAVINKEAEESKADVVTVKGNRFVLVYEDRADLIVLNEDKPVANGEVKVKTVSINQIADIKRLTKLILSGQELNDKDKVLAEQYGLLDD